VLIEGERFAIREESSQKHGFSANLQGNDEMATFLREISMVEL
jgi:hypothetical protein